MIADILRHPVFWDILFISFNYIHLKIIYEWYLRKYSALNSISFNSNFKYHKSYKYNNFRQKLVIPFIISRGIIKQFRDI